MKDKTIVRRDHKRPLRFTSQIINLQPPATRWHIERITIMEYKNQYFDSLEDLQKHFAEKEFKSWENVDEYYDSLHVRAK